MHYGLHNAVKTVYKKNPSVAFNQHQDVPMKLRSLARAFYPSL